VSRAFLNRHGGSNTALSRAKRRRSDDAAEDEEPSALDPGHDGSVGMEKASDGAHASGGDEEDEATDSGVLHRTGGHSVGAWAVNWRGLDSGGDGDGSVKAKAVMMASRWGRDIFPWTCCRTSRCLMAATTMKNIR